MDCIFQVLGVTCGLLAATSNTSRRESEVEFMRIFLVLVIVGGFACSSCQTLSPEKPNIYDLVEQFGLPTSGIAIRNPKNPSEWLYYASRTRMIRDPANSKKEPGLWLSQDAGRTWFGISGIPDFEYVFVHPKTEIVYAIIGIYDVQTGPDRVFQARDSGKILMLKQRGLEWYDITENAGYIQNLRSIFSDPDNPDRVCLYQDAPILYVYQSVDNEYSRWHKLTRKEWENTHPGWNWDKVFTEVFNLGPKWTL
jgi:hypothetical protein